MDMLHHTSMDMGLVVLLTLILTLLARNLYKTRGLLRVLENEGAKLERLHDNLNRQTHKDDLDAYSVCSADSGKAPPLSSLDYFHNSNMSDSQHCSPQRNDTWTGSVRTLRYSSASRVGPGDRSTSRASPVQLDRLPLPRQRSGNWQHKMAATQNRNNVLSGSENLCFMTEESSQIDSSSGRQSCQSTTIELNVYDDSGRMTKHEVIELRDVAARHFK